MNKSKKFSFPSLGEKSKVEVEEVTDAPFEEIEMAAEVVEVVEAEVEEVTMEYSYSVFIQTIVSVL